MFILVRQTICGAMLIRVGKLQFIGLIGGRILTWGDASPRRYCHVGARGPNMVML